MLINPVVSMTFFAIMFYLYGFSIGARECRFFFYGLLFFVLGWIPQTIILMDSELQYGLMHDVTLPILAIGILIAVGFTIIFYVTGYLSGRAYRHWRNKHPNVVKRKCDID